MKSFLGIICSYCNTYFRIYKDPSGKKYEGRCPKCYRCARALIDPGKGMKRRFFIYR
ncbi:MAG: hypothetical protein ABIK28_15915 [Planctomycetota bacterium]